jgi:tripartite-type tricarboxylate transporter receptor subunit TctC
MKTFRVAALLVLVASSLPGWAQYPNKTVRIVTTSAPGTAPDLLARSSAAYLQNSLKQPFVVETRTGGGGNVASEAVARSAPDGYTLLVAADPVFAINPHLYKNLTFDALKDLVPVASIMSQPFALIVNLNVPARTVRDFIEHAKRAPKPLFYGTAGAGSASHLAMEMLKSRTGVNLVHVPFQGGGAPLMTAMLSGDVHATIGGTAALAQVRAGKLAAIASTGLTRSSHLPDLPPIAETVPGYELVSWMGMFAPAGVSSEVLGRLRPEMSAYVSSGDTKTRFASMGGIDPLIMKPEEFVAFIRHENERFGKIIRELKITAD